MSAREPVKPGYKQTEVGVIPEDWQEFVISEKTLKVGSGITPTGGSRVYKQYGRPFVRSQNVGWGALLLDDLAYIDDATHRSFESTEIKLNDVLLNITGASIGRSAVADARIEMGNVNQHVCIIRPKVDELDPRFLNYFLLSREGQSQIDSFQAGGNRQGLNFGQIKAFRLPTPTQIQEQRAIVAALSDVDALIPSLDALIAKKRDLKQAAMQRLLTGKTRLPGFSGEWRKAQFGDVAKIRNEKINTLDAPQAEFCVELEQVKQGAGLIECFTDARNRISIKYHFRRNDVLFGRLRPYLRKFWLADRDGVCSTEIWPLASIGDVISARYLFQSVRTDAFVEAASTAYGTHMPRADWTVLRRFVLDLPIDLDEQSAIAVVLSDMDAEITALEDKRDKTRALKAGMMQELLTGRIRLI